MSVGFLTRSDIPTYVATQNSCDESAGMLASSSNKATIMILNFRTDRSGQTVLTLNRLILEEQSDQGLHCLLFHLHVFDTIPSGLASLLEI